MADFGAAKNRRTRFGYLGHRVRGVSKSNQKKSPSLGNVGSATEVSKLSKIKSGLNCQKRLQSLSKQDRRSRIFNLNEDDDEEVLLKGGKEGPIPVGNASRKNILESLKDDFEDNGLILSDDEEESKQLNPLLTRTLQFGSGGGAAVEGRAKTRRERLQEAMAKNKARKAQHAHNVYEQSSLLEEADEMVSSLLKDLDFKPSRQSSDYKNRIEEEARDAELADNRTKDERARDDDFDNLMKQLAHKPKLHPGDRKLTLAERNYEAKRQRKIQETRMQEDLKRAAATANDQEPENYSQDEEDDESDDDESEDESDSGDEEGASSDNDDASTASSS